MRKRDPENDDPSDYDGALHWAACYMLAYRKKPKLADFESRGWTLEDRGVRYVLEHVFGCERFVSEGGTLDDPWEHPGRMHHVPTCDTSCRSRLGMCVLPPRGSIIELDNGLFVGWIGGGAIVPGEEDATT